MRRKGWGKDHLFFRERGGGWRHDRGRAQDRAKERKSARMRTRAAPPLPPPVSPCSNTEAAAAHLPHIMQSPVTHRECTHPQYSQPCTPHPRSSSPPPSRVRVQRPSAETSPHPSRTSSTPSHSHALPSSASPRTAHAYTPAARASTSQSVHPARGPWPVPRTRTLTAHRLSPGMVQHHLHPRGHPPRTHRQHPRPRVRQGQALALQRIRSVPPSPPAPSIR